jgi:hypothetical protein
MALTAALLLAFLSISTASASNALYSCTKDASAVFRCDQTPAVGQHVQLNTVPGACHVSITQLRTGRSGSKLADVTVAHALNCPWPTGSLQTITYTAPVSPAVGGIAGLIEMSTTPSDVAPSSTGWPSTLPLLAGLGGAAICAITAGGATLRRQMKKRP